MSVRKKQLDRQRAEEEKLNEDIHTGRVIRVHYEERKKKNSLPNRVNIKGSTSEQKEDDQATVEKTVYRQMLPSLLSSISKIKDPRAPHKVKHKITTLFIYGIIMFVFQIGSRRQVNREMTDIGFENLKSIFPELEKLPHGDTLASLLEVIDVSQIRS